MNRLGLSVVLSTAIAAGVFACGGIADPTRGGESVATISGALTGTTVPADARVAVVWRKGNSGGFEVASDAPVVGGKFTLTLAVPPSSYFSSLDDDGYGDSISGGSGSGGGSSSGSYDPPPPPPAEPDPGSSTSGSGGYEGKSLQPQTTVSGEITSPLMAAVAGFVVYVDANGNGKLDIEGSHAGSPDTILGGNRELVLAYLQGGGSLDYEKLRDRSGILPQAGFNLAWERGERWLPLNVVELKISDRQGLPSGVCGGTSYYGEEPNVSPPEPVPDMDGGAAPGYPHPDDPNLTCDPDGRGFSYYESYTCPEPDPVPQGLCTRGYDVPSVGCGGAGGWGTRLADGEPVPPGWPCPVEDGGALDGGGYDAGFDGGDSDAGPP
jgi:hypothetical protein